MTVVIKPNEALTLIVKEGDNISKLEIAQPAQTVVKLATAPGRGVTDISRTAGNGSSGTTDTYTITYSDSSTSTFNVYNGLDGVGNMTKAVYDTTDNGIVDAAESVPWTGVTGKPALLVSGDIGVTVQGYDTDLAAWAGKTAPTGDAVGTTDTQTLTNKTLSGVVLNDGYVEEVFSITGTTPALSPNNGSIQTWVLSGNSTPTAGTWANGQSITLMVDDGTAYAITWTSVAVTWKTDGGIAPALNASGFTAIALWKVGSTIYGARVGDA